MIHLYRLGIGLFALGALCAVFGVLLLLAFPTNPWWMVGVWGLLLLAWFVLWTYTLFKEIWS